PRAWPVTDAIGQTWNIDPAGSHSWTVLDDLPMPTDQNVGGGTPAQVLQVGAFEAVALPTEQLQVVHRGGTAQSHRDDVVVLKVELASALGALATISFEHGPADLAGDGPALSRGPRLPAFIDVEHHVRPVQP